MTHRQTILWRILLVGYALLAVVYSLALPLGEGADEVHHFRYIRFVREQLALPAPLVDYTPLGYAPVVMAHHPPLYYGLAALWCAACDVADGESALPYNPHFVWRVNDGQDGFAVHLAPPDFWQGGSVLALRWLRLFSVLLGMMTLTAVYRTSALIFPNHEWLPAIATSLAVFNPSFLAISSTLHNDILVTAGFALSLWWMVRTVAYEPRPSWAQIGMAGVLAGGTLLAKLTGLVLWPLFGLTLLFVAWQPTPTEKWRVDWGWLFTRGAGLLGTAVFLSGWWFFRNNQLYGSPLPVNDIMRQIFPHVYRESYTLRLILTELYQQLGQGFWGAFSYLHITVPSWVSTFWWGFTAVGLLGFFLWGWQQRRTLKLTLWQGQAWLILLTAALLIFVALIYLGSSMSGAGQARYLMPVVGVIGLVLAVGWLNLLPIFRFLLQPILLLLMPFYALATLIWFIQPLYAPAPRVAVLPPTAVSSPLPLAPDLMLVGYALEPAIAPLDGTAELQLFWQKTAPSETDWLLHLGLYDQFGAVVSEQQVWPEPNSSTAVWPSPNPDETNPIIMTSHPLTIPPYVAAGTAQLYLALAPGRGAPLTTEAQPVGLLRLAEPSLVERLPSGAKTTPYEVGEGVRLVGYTAVANNDQLQLDLYWRTSQPLATDYTVFVQLLHNGELIAQQDNQPNQNRYPTSAWQPDTLIKDSYTLPLPPITEQTEYEIITGMYEWPSLTRLPISEAGEPRGDYIRLPFPRGR